MARDNAKHARRYRERYPEKVRAQARASKIWCAYGLTVEEYDKLMAEGCAICGGEATHMDHDHKTNRVRKALCSRHNTGLGKFNDDPLELLKGMRYLIEHESS